MLKPQPFGAGYQQLTKGHEYLFNNGLPKGLNISTEKSNANEKTGSRRK